MDKFSTRYGYIPGRCNTRRHFPNLGKLCKSYPRKGLPRCRLHGSTQGTIRPPHVRASMSVGMTAYHVSRRNCYGVVCDTDDPQDKVPFPTL